MLRKVLSSSRDDAPGLARGLMLISLILLSAQDALVKIASSHTNLWQFQISRAGLNLVYLLIIAHWFARHDSLWPKNARAVLARATFQLCALSFFFAGAPFLSLAEMAGGLYTFPLFVVLLSTIVLREKVGPWRLLAVMMGFGGTLLILKPGAESFRLAGLLPVCAGFCYGCFVITTRKYCREETPVVMVIVSNAMTIVAGTLIAIVIALSPFSDSQRDAYPYLLSDSWHFDHLVLGIIFICAALNTIANLFLGKAYQSADSSLLAPVDYSYLVFASIWGWLIWKDVPPATTITGMVLIAIAGVFVAWRTNRPA